MSEEKKQDSALDAERVAEMPSELQPEHPELHPEEAESAAEVREEEAGAESAAVPSDAAAEKSGSKKTGRLLFNVTPGTLCRYQSKLGKPSDAVMLRLLDCLDEVESGRSTKSARLLAEKEQAYSRLLAEKSRLAAECERAEKEIAGYKQQIAELKAELSSLRGSAQPVPPAVPKADVQPGGENLYPQGDILHYFPAITARMLSLTAERLTAARKDGMEVTPAMVLGDMFNKYSIQRFNLWFYKFVLDDKDIVQIAQSVNSRLTNIRMVRAALGIH